MEADVSKSDNRSYQAVLTLTEDDLAAYDSMSDLQDLPHADATMALGSKHYCVTVADAAGRPIHRETIKTHPVWAPVRAFAIMRAHGGAGYHLRGGQC